MNVIIVREVDYDGWKLGRCWKMCVCATKEAAGHAVEVYTKPISYHDGLRKFEPHVHREDRETIIGYRGPGPTFVYVEEKEVLE